MSLRMWMLSVFLIGFILSGCSRHCVEYGQTDCVSEAVGTMILNVSTVNSYHMIKKSFSGSHWVFAEDTDYFHIDIASDHYKYTLKEGHYEIKRYESKCSEKCVKWVAAFR